ncbi:MULTISPECIES: PQQ-dependent catabolism-associated CXXCW motif protein [unclassified Pseudomonas]|uniref:PQQ-dependent catabolism-associated CXXCW motif protein n=1 Tax=unclassified Pseudomonas TaxID=196821 RepID=UPI0019146A2D|nr:MULTISPECIES: PQQ-dependent catabolism-associated CXXCW motif protein [unclassified Pseudomonas]MBK5551091.1 PQQ-dependent catabolism-associated CXXCW motif protein [Pseudomonas sp. TH03]MEB0226982.1 PQQ-dependent catabolism-associated CXXCW motif protein [Pseudomonas sp. 5S1]MEB0296095.1 PQQ-dependent catabolism-associated CXXCW motif protein [Pseudomonas sp. 10S4]WPX17707.1 PQQ-dependent catabolism-associated CXXCW motif protein [Pseudomonas sp. 10S4]
MPRARRRLLRPCLTALSLSLLLSTAHADTPLFSADGYRIGLYRSPTPNQLQGATIIDTPALQTLLSQTPRPVLIDVYRRQWLQGRFIEDQPHENLPGSHWLANTGDGDLTPDWQAWFARNLDKFTDGDPQQPLVFYCRADCWLSWNAVKRAAAMGYKSVYWYRDGLDAWQAANLPVAAAQPEPFP